MRKIAIIFVVAVLAPSLVLAWLAVRSLGTQELVLERQQALLCQEVTERFVVRRGGQTEELTARELKLLQLFHAHPGEVLSRDRLLNEVWGYHYYGTTRTLDQVIVQVRRKLGDKADEPRYLLTVHGVGYKLAL